MPAPAGRTASTCSAAVMRVSTSVVVSPVVSVLHGHADDGARLEVDGLLCGMSQVRAAVLHLRDLRVRIVWVRPVVVGPFLLPRSVEPGQLGARRRGDAGRRGEPGQPGLVRLARVPAHDAPHRRVGFERRRVDPNGVPVHQVGLRQPLQHPGEDRLMRFHVNQSARARQRRMIRRGLVQVEVQEVPNTQRISRTPRDRPL